MEDNELICTVIIEHLDITGTTVKRSQHKNATLLLGRNEFREIILKIDLGKKEEKYIIREVCLHRKFIKDGKATVKLIDQKVQFLLSNCPPDALLVFLKTLSAKYTILRQEGFISDRKKLLSGVPRSFQGVSPLSVKDVECLQNIRTKQAERKGPFKTPGKKRKRANESPGKENIPLDVKAAKKALVSPRSVINPVKLTSEQTAVLKAVQSGKNIFFTGSAGTGKSFLLKKIVGNLAPHHTCCTASTGVAACHIGGTTLHSFAGIGSGAGSLEQCVELASRKTVAQQWKKCQHLIIDEISMVDADFFTKLEAVARVIKKSDNPFGGIQLILCGDFLQLPPISKATEKKKFCFQSSAWRKCEMMNMELCEVKRQSDNKFINLLQNVRLGRCSDDVVKVLKSTSKHQIDRDGILATRLCTHKEDVNQLNTQQLEQLPGEVHEFVACDSDPMLAKQINQQCPVPQKLTLKVGTQVMLAKNLDVHRGLVNGARGVVTEFEKADNGGPIVKFRCGVRLAVRQVRWTIKANGGIYLTRKQLPLQLAWAISIHKSQGMSLDCVELSLSRVFECGQAYVALSRATSLEGLRVIDFERSCVRTHPDVLKFYRKLFIQSKTRQTLLEM